MFRRSHWLVVVGMVWACIGTARAEPKVVIIGFDGADSGLVEQWMQEGHLPHLSALAADGAYSPLQPTNPPQTPVSWSAFATGMRPGKTEIFDFLKRDPNNYIPDFALMTEGKRTFLFGRRNGLAVGAAAGLVVGLVVLLLSLALRVRWPIRVGLALLLGIGAALPVASTASELLPLEVPDAKNNRKGATMWELAANAGLKAQVIRVPTTFPAEPIANGHMLSGLGVPDMRGRVGTPSYYTSDPTFGMDNNDFSLEIVKLPARRGRVETRIIGPYNKPFYDFVVERETRDSGANAREESRRIRAELDQKGVQRRIDLPLVLEASDDSLTYRVSGRSGSLRPGEWSDWVTLDFPVNGLVDRIAPLQGVVRLKLLALEPEIELYVSPIGFHPDCHPVAFSWPEDYSEELLDRFGMYKTLGWALDTWSPSSDIVDEELFFEDMQATVDTFETMMTGLLKDGDHDLFVQIFYFPDRIGHLLWRYMDEQHPRYDADKAPRMRAKLLEAYQRMDTLVGKARELAGEEALFMVLSDHGFSSFRRGVNYNNWLVENGLMTLEGQAERANLEKLFDSGDLFQNVNWAETKAYAIGLGSIYVNLLGREREGIVQPGPEYDEVRRQIVEGLEAIVDPVSGARPIPKVYTREEMYGEGTFDRNLIPDLRAATALDYRVSWQTTLGGFGDGVVEDNTRPWSGDHCSNDPNLVRGIFFVNRPLAAEQPRMIDVMPTVLRALGVEIPDAVDGEPLL